MRTHFHVLDFSKHSLKLLIAVAPFSALTLCLAVCWHWPCVTLLDSSSYYNREREAVKGPVQGYTGKKQRTGDANTTDLSSLLPELATQTRESHPSGNFVRAILSPNLSIPVSRANNVLSKVRSWWERVKICQCTILWSLTNYLKIHDDFASVLYHGNIAFYKKNSWFSQRIKRAFKK